MKPILLLSSEPETVRLMLEEVTSGSVALRESEARAGCICDRWGHPYAGRLERNRPYESRRSVFVTSQIAR